MTKLVPGAVKIHISIRDGDSRAIVIQEGRNVPKTNGLSERIPRAMDVLINFLLNGGKP
ncbi:MAG: hypothetical protein M0Z77_08820 [Thermoplasmatales archaeon]|nr:hypothetical protein [Thermoplasmatales archaeon]